MKRLITLLASLVLASMAGAAGDLNWEHNYDDALQKAKKEKKLVMVDVYTDWCGWCKKLDKDVYSNADVKTKLAEKFVALKINPEKSRKNAELAQSFGTRGFPHIVFVDAEGKKVSEILGYIPADQFKAK